jgi:hypothetical protein
MPENAPWIKPIWPGDIPEGTTPVWNSTLTQWDYIPLPVVSIFTATSTSTSTNSIV